MYCVLGREVVAEKDLLYGELKEYFGALLSTLSSVNSSMCTIIGVFS